MKRKNPALLATLATAALIGAVSAQTHVTMIHTEPSLVGWFRRLRRHNGSH